MAEYKHISNTQLQAIRENIKTFKSKNPKRNYNSLFVVYQKYNSQWDTLRFHLFNSDDRTQLDFQTAQKHTKYYIESPYLFNIKNSKNDGTNESSMLTFYFNISTKEFNTLIEFDTSTLSKYKIGEQIDENLLDHSFLYTTQCFFKEPYKSEFVGCRKKYPLMGEIITELEKHFLLNEGCNNPDKPPTPKPGKNQQQEYFFIDKVETMKYLQGQDITISCEVDDDGAEFENAGVLFQYQLEGQDTYTDVKAEVTTSSTGKKRIWVRVKLP